MDAGLNVGERSVGPNRVQESCQGIDVCLLVMKNEKPDHEINGLKRGRDNPRCASKTRSESGRKHQPTFTAVEIDRQCPSQHDGEKRKEDPHDETKHPCLNCGTSRDCPVHHPIRRRQPRLRRGQPRLYGNVGRVLVPRGIHAGGNFVIRNRNFNADLGSAALRAKRAAVFNRRSTLLAAVLHVFEASAQRSGEQDVESSDH